jgi:hypothetical protein
MGEAPSPRIQYLFPNSPKKKIPKIFPNSPKKNFKNFSRDKTIYIVTPRHAIRWIVKTLLEFFYLSSI